MMTKRNVLGIHDKKHTSDPNNNNKNHPKLVASQHTPAAWSDWHCSQHTKRNRTKAPRRIHANTS